MSKRPRTDIQQVNRKLRAALRAKTQFRKEAESLQSRLNHTVTELNSMRDQIEKMSEIPQTNRNTMLVADIKIMRFSLAKPEPGKMARGYDLTIYTGGDTKMLFVEKTVDACIRRIKEEI